MGLSRTERVERIRIAPIGSPRRTFFLAISKEGPDWLTGKELDGEGGWDGVIHLIDKAAIVKRTPVGMNLHYGVFEEA